MPASLLETAAADPLRPRLPRPPPGGPGCGRCPRCGGRRWPPRCSRPGWPPTSRTPRALWRGRSSWPATRPAAGSRGWPGLRALRARTLDVDLLMVLAAIGAAAVGQVLDGGLLIVIFATSGALEAVATHRTAQAVRGLLDLAPEQATRLDEARRRAGRGRGEPADRRRDPGPPGRADRRRRAGAVGRERRGPGHDHRRAAAGRQEPRRRGVRRHPQRHRRAAGAGRAGPPPTPWSPGSSRWSSRPRRPRPGRSCSSRRSSSATRSAWSPRPCCCSRSRCSPAPRSSPPCCAR